MITCFYPTRLYLLCLIIMVILATGGNVIAAAKDGKVILGAGEIKPGAKLDISGKWLFKPGYALTANERPEDPSAKEDGYVTVPVPQMLSRIRWWLDDSEGFKAFEEKRLKALGFDTERAEDGWYRLWIEVPEGLGDRSIFVRFDGIAMKSRIYVNGTELGQHTGMFSRFGFDLAPHLRPGKNLLAVYVSMEKMDPDVTPLGEAVTVNLTMSKVVSLSKGMFGPLSPVNDNRAYDLYGIWQPVTLEFRQGGKIEDAWFIPKLDTAEVKLELSSIKGEQDGLASVRWTDAKTGKLLHETKKTPVKLAPEKQTVVLSANGLKPKLWSPDKPDLYKMEVRLEDGSGNLLDLWKQNVGFRTFEVKGNQLYLNGRRYWLRGANQLPYGKNPWDKKLAERLIRLAHDGNTVITRTHCTPWNEDWLDAADEIGLGVSIEGMRPWAFVGKIPPPSREMMDHWKMENENVIRRCRNHPSVLIWTVGNEMSLRDDENVDKWALLSEMVKQTRQIDPTRPVICSSGFHRDRKFYEEKLKPLGIDDGDMEDLHSYRGWYATSSFVQDSSWIERMCDYKGERPIIGQEMATGYPNLDNGIPVTNYSVKLMVPQVWVGKDGDLDGDPSAFLEHQKIVTKRMAEQLRFQRGDLTSGFLLFSSECWFRNTYDPDRVSPYPVYEGVKQAFAPVGLALETHNRRFFAGDTIRTAVLVTNDDRDITGPMSLIIELADPDGKNAVEVGRVELSSGIDYYQTIRIPVAVQLPQFTGRKKAVLRTMLVKGSREISRTDDPVEVFGRRWVDAPLNTLKAKSVYAAGIGNGVKQLIAKAPEGAVTVSDTAFDPNGYGVAIVGGDTCEQEFAAVKSYAENGGTAVVLNLGERGEKLFPDQISRSRDTSGEYVDMSVAPGEIASGLDRFDCKWWGRRDGWAYVISASHNLAPKGNAKMLARHIVVHGYIPEEKKPEYVTSPLVEIPMGKGRIILSEFCFDDSAGIDPMAGYLFAKILSWTVK